MTIEEAIKTALEFENKVEQTYREAMSKATDPAGKRVFETLAKEEQGHIQYLESRLTEWQKTGHLTLETLDTVVPSKAVIQQGVERLKREVDTHRGVNTEELEMLQRALEVELETGAFYRRMVSELADEGQQLFQRFLEIEDGHATIVQAEIDSVQGLGYWFDVQEWKFQDG